MTINRGLAAAAAGLMTVGLIAGPGSASAVSAATSTSPRLAVMADVPSATVRAELAKLEAAARADFAGRRTAAARQRLRGPGSITGQVLGSNELPFRGACVTAVRQSSTVTAAAAANGTFRIAGLAAGSYALEYRDCASPGKFLTRWSGDATEISGAARVRVAAGGEKHVPTMTLPSANPAAGLPDRASWQKMLAASAGHGLSAAAALNTGRITGVVTGNGHRLRNICVISFPTKSGQGYGARTSRNGFYALRHMKPGPYYVVFAPFEICRSSGNWLQQWYRGHNTPFGVIGNVVRVASGKATRHVDAALRLGGEISGTVRSPSGRRLSGICVDVGAEVNGGFVGLGAKTSKTGSYHLPALFPGRYGLRFVLGCGAKGNFAPATRLIRIHGQVASGVSVTLAVGATITGTVRLGSSTGTPLAGICIYAGNRRGTIFTQALTRSDGTYRVDGLATGSYHVDAEATCRNRGNYVATRVITKVTTGKVTSGVDVVMQPGAQLSGTVTDTNGKPLSNLCAALIVPESYLANSVVTLNDGSYVIDQLPAGTYELGFFGGCGNRGSYAPYWYKNQTNVSLATPITLTTGESQVINVVMQPGVTIHGTVTDVRGHILPGVCVYVATPGDVQLFGAFEQAASTGPRGHYSIRNLAPGPYYVNFGCGGRRKYADQWFDNAPDPNTAKKLDLSAGTTSGISAVMQPPGSITGKVTDKSGRPFSRACVFAVDKVDVTSSDPVLVQAAGYGRTNSQGAYKISGLASGRYDVQFSQCKVRSRYAQQWYRQANSVGTATAVRVKAGANTPGIGAKLVLGGSIAGSVFGATHNPLPAICVAAFSLANYSYGYGITRKDGRYSIAGLSSGQYILQFAPCFGKRKLGVAYAEATVHAARATTGVNATLVRGGSIAGTVTTAGPSSTPVPFICVDVASNISAAAPLIGETRLDGTYRVTGLAPGSYTVHYDPECLLSVPLAPQWYNDKPSQAMADTVVVTAGETTIGIDAVLQQEGEITGTVLGPASRKITGACVSAVPMGGGSPPFVGISRSGDYTLPQLPPGQYEVKFSSGCGATGYVTQWWQNAPSQQTATVVTVQAGQTVSGISATLTQ